MIVQSISAGLGNQMFMYAFGRAISLSKGEQLFLDISYFRKKGLRDYGLDKLNISKEAYILQDKCINNAACTIKKWICGKIVERRRIQTDDPEQIMLMAKKGYFYYTGRNYIEPVYSNRYINYYSGIFQSEKYFSAYSDVIKKELRVSAKVSKACSDLAEKMKMENSVCVHIRRGDYLSSPMHNVCQEGYYERAIQTIKEYVTNPIFYFFSDDPTWVMEHYKGESYFVVDMNNKDYEDLYLMYHCNHFIIPNSTFSWWGQYLSNNPNKIVVAPERWYNSLPVNATDIYMESWIRIPVDGVVDKHGNGR